jgi:Methyltransferase domain
MPYQLDLELTAEQKAYMSRFSAESWSTSVDFKNASSQRHPSSKKLEANNEMKRGLVSSWIRNQVKGKRVLDLFCANGAFSVEAALAGAREVVGVDFSQERVHCARFLAGTLERSPPSPNPGGDAYWAAPRRGRRRCTCGHCSTALSPGRSMAC